MKQRRILMSALVWASGLVIAIVTHASAPLVFPERVVVSPVCDDKNLVDWRPDATPLYFTHDEYFDPQPNSVFVVTDRHFRPLGLIDVHVHREIEYRGSELIECL